MVLLKKEVLSLSQGNFPRHKAKLLTADYISHLLLAQGKERVHSIIKRGRKSVDWMIF